MGNWKYVGKNTIGNLTGSWQCRVSWQPGVSGETGVSWPFI